MKEKKGKKRGKRRGNKGKLKGEGKDKGERRERRIIERHLVEFREEKVWGPSKENNEQIMKNKVGKVFGKELLSKGYRKSDQNDEILWSKNSSSSALDNGVK